MKIKLKRILKNIIKKILASQGYIIVQRNASAHTMEETFRTILQRKHSLNTVIDIGASDGRWAGSMIKYFPSCQYLLVEAQPVHEEALKRFSSENRNVQFVMAAAGEAPGQIYFDAGDPFGGQASYKPYASSNIQVPVTTVDNEIQTRKLSGPYLIKLDTHGFEVPILKGATLALAETEVIIMECYNFKIAPECLLFFEMCDYLKQFGFRCIDLLDPMNRPYDESFWQMDLVFVKDDRPEFSYLEYR